MRRLVESIRSTATTGVEVVFRIDADDQPSIDAAATLGVRAVIGPRKTMSDLWNDAAAVACGDILMLCGDDIAFRTPGWDQQVVEAINSVPDRIVLVHGDDGVHGARHGTHPFVHRRWVDALGYLVPPGFSCDYTDTWLCELANHLGRQVYLADVVTEHLHPVVGKADLDQTHQERLARGRRDNVEALYAVRAPHRARDVDKLRALLETP